MRTMEMKQARAASFEAARVIGGGGERSERTYSGVLGSGKITVLCLDDLDMRTNSAKRARELITSLEEEYGGGDGIEIPLETKIRIVDLACLNAMTEDLVVKFFNGEPVDRLAFAALVNVKRRLLSSL